MASKEDQEQGKKETEHKPKSKDKNVSSKPAAKKTGKGSLKASSRSDKESTSNQSSGDRSTESQTPSDMKESINTHSPAESSEDQGKYSGFPVVAMGASAGGLEAFEQFFRHMPDDSGIAFAVVQHMDPSRKSMLPELLQRYTGMQVVQVEDGMGLKPNHVFVIPPNRYMTIEDGRLRLLQTGRGAHPRDKRLAYDLHANSYLLKPGTIEELEDLIGNLVNCWLKWN